MIFDLPKGETADIIFLTRTENEDVFKMTSTAINSLVASEAHNNFRVIVVESGKQNVFIYENASLTIPFLDADFNYNKAINMATQYLESDIVGVFNNDVIFTEDWYSQLRYYMDLFRLDSASPWCPVPQNGVNQQVQDTILRYSPHTVVNGYEVLKHFAGWGWVMRRTVLESLLPQPEDLSFWFVDNHMCNQLISMNYKHATVTSSLVVHLGQKSYTLIPKDKIEQMTTGLYERFLSKWMK